MNSFSLSNTPNGMEPIMTKLDFTSKFRQVSPEVFYSDGNFLAVDKTVVDFLKENAKITLRKRCRLCFHNDAGDAQQEMLIVMHRNSYVRPHRHFEKIETLGVIEGNSDALLFDDEGNVTNVIAMSPAGGSGAFHYRMPEKMYHSLIFHSEWFVFLETTIGPFDRTTTEEGCWAPAETDQKAGLSYLKKLI